MSLFSAEERRFASAVSQLIYCNPFLPERIEFEKSALGDEFDERGANWNIQLGSGRKPPNVVKLVRRTGELLERLRARVATGEVEITAGPGAGLYEDLLMFALFDGLGFGELGPAQPEGDPATLYKQLEARARPFLCVGGLRLPLIEQLPHVFACFYQLQRAFQNIFHYIIGFSRAAVQLRAAVWQSIFTHDMRRYRRTLFARMSDFTTLITGPSGTGKELVARAIGLSRYVPFDPKSRTFGDESAELFFPLNLSALSPTVIESELFGHRRGSFTGADVDRAGWLEVCPPLGTVFLDEIGDLDTTIQVKLLRVLQSRTFSRLGDTETRRFEGKIIAATNCDLSKKMQSGQCREDFYYRLCSDIVVVPSLAQRLADSPGELKQLISYLVQRAVGEEAPDIAAEVEQVIEKRLGMDYSWPGNIRELEQCVRNVVVRKQYAPPQLAGRRTGSDIGQSLADEVARASLTVDELLRRYCTLVYAQTGSFEATARRLQIDRRTVKAKVDPKLLPEFS
jgi:transcriptional regulator with AAA-type ATPase domain